MKAENDKRVGENKRSVVYTNTEKNGRFLYCSEIFHLKKVEKVIIKLCWKNFVR